MAAQFDSLKGSSLVPKNEQSVEAHILLYLFSAEILQPPTTQA